MRKKMMMPMVLSILAMGLLVGCDGNKAENTGNVRTESVVTNESSTNKKEISSEKAKEIALEDAGMSSESDTSHGVSIEREMDDGQVEYKVSFENEQFEYEYEISASDGAILGMDKEEIEQIATNNGEISSEKAKEIALKDAGVKEADIKNLSVKREVDDGQVEYDVSFEKGQIEYEYEILAENGKILTSEKDTVDH